MHTCVNSINNIDGSLADDQFIEALLCNWRHTVITVICTGRIRRPGPARPVTNQARPGPWPTFNIQARPGPARPAGRPARADLCSWYPKLVFSTNIPFQTQNTSLQNCFPSLGFFPSPWTVYPDFDSCYSHFMPYRMTPGVRHRAIEVHYYYYYYYYYPTQVVPYIDNSLGFIQSMHLKCIQSTVRIAS